MSFEANANNIWFVAERLVDTGDAQDRMLADDSVDGELNYFAGVES